MLASRVQNLNISGIRKIFNRAASMENCINLSIGQTDFDVPLEVKAAAIRSIEEGFNKYSPTGGIPTLQSAIRRRLQQRYNVDCESVFVTNGVSGGLTLSFMALVEEGDEVLIPDPFFVVYKVLTEQFGGTPVFYNTYPDYRLHKEEIASKISDRTKLIIVNTPQNPTGTCYTREELEWLNSIAVERGILILSDEAYDYFDYDQAFTSMLEVNPNMLTLSGFSKTLSMPGWRIGYATGPQELLDKMQMLQQFTFVCAPSPFQKACAEALDVDISPFVDDHRRKRDMMYNGLKDRFEIVKPAGGLYLFIKVPWEGVTGTEFVEKCLDHNILLVPGGAFSLRDTHFRLCFGASDEQLQAGMEILNRIADEPVASRHTAAVPDEA